MRASRSKAVGIARVLRGTVAGTLTALLAPIALSAIGAPAWAAPQDEGGGEEAAAEGDGADEDVEDDAGVWFAIVGGDVYTGTGAVLRGATILAKDGVIKEIGYDLYVPEDAKQLDASGMRCYPGMVALNASRSISTGLFGSVDQPAEELDPHFGLDEKGQPQAGPATGDTAAHPELEEEPADEAEVDAPWPFLQGEEGETPSGFKPSPADGFDPFSQYLVLALATGITTAEQSNVAMKLKRRSIEGVVMNEKGLVTIAWSRRNPSSIRRAKEDFAAAAKYLREFRVWEDVKDKDKEAKEPSRKGVDTNALRILKGEVLARFNNDDREELLGIARFAQEYGFRPVIFGCVEGWTVADELGRAGAYAVVTPRARSPKDETLVRPGGSSIENAALLHRAGVQVAIVPANTGFELSGMTGRDLMHLPVEAGFAIRGGLPEEAAFAGMTTIPARILGVEHRVGTLEVGKDCDVIITDGDVLHYQTFVQFAVVEAELVYDKQEELYYAHIRPRPERPVFLTPEKTEEAAEEPKAEEPEAKQQDEAEKEKADDDEAGEEEEEKKEEEKKDDGKEDDKDAGSAGR